MHLYYNGVNDAFRGLIQLFSAGGPQFKRVHYSNPNGNGYTIRVDEPVTLTYARPTQVVLFNQARDCNPFSLLYEGLYHLCGRHDVAPLSYYTKRFETFSDDGWSFNASYGYRWRCAAWVPELKSLGYYRPGLDQLDLLVVHLKANPTSRRAVLTMWNVEDDLLKVVSSRDIACNLMVKFSIKEVENPPAGTPCHTCGGKWTAELAKELDEVPPPATCPNCSGGTPFIGRVLDMTVFNRSNDLCWGALGANYVTFSFLLQYMAARLGVGVGRYNQISDDLHVYDRHVEEMPKWLEDQTPDYYQPKASDQYPKGGRHVLSASDTAVPLVRDPAVFDVQVKRTVDLHRNDECGLDNEDYPTEPFLARVAVPAFRAFHYHKRKQTDRAMSEAANITADDWRGACTAWLERRKK